MKVLLVISSLSSGGAERVMTTLASNWIKQGVDVTLLTLFSEETDFYELHAKITRVVLNQASPSRHILDGVVNNVQRIRGLRNTFIRIKPDYIVSFLEATNILCLIADLGLKTPIIVSERIDPRKNNIGMVREFLRRLFYPRAKAVVVQTSSVAQWAEKVIPKANTVVIPNPVRVPEPTDAVKHDNIRDEKIIVSMGRLTSQKGFDLLIKAFAICVKKHENCKLLIMGEGELRSELKNLVDTIGLENKVVFLGRINDPDRVLKSADLFVLSSRFEGFPNALVEAMACGLPVISFDCPSGPADIITNEVNGLLVNDCDVEQLSLAIQRLIYDPKLALALAKEAEKITDKFSIERVMNQWSMLMPTES